MSSMFGGGAPDTSKAERLQKEQMALQKAQARKTAEKERSERQAEAARERALRSKVPMKAGQRKTMFKSYLGVPPSNA